MWPKLTAKVLIDSGTGICLGARHKREAWWQKKKVKQSFKTVVEFQFSNLDGPQFLELSGGKEGRVNTASGSPPAEPGRNQAGKCFLQVSEKCFLVWYRILRLLPSLGSLAQLHLILCVFFVPVPAPVPAPVLSIFLKKTRSVLEGRRVRSECGAALCCAVLCCAALVRSSARSFFFTKRFEGQRGFGFLRTEPKRITVGNTTKVSL